MNVEVKEHWNDVETVPFELLLGTFGVYLLANIMGSLVLIISWLLVSGLCDWFALCDYCSVDPSELAFKPSVCDQVVFLGS